MSEPVTNMQGDTSIVLPNGSGDQFAIESSVTQASTPGRIRAGSGRVLAGFASVLVFIGLWWLVAVLVVRDDTILPTPWSVVTVTVHYFNRSYPGYSVPIWQDILYSMVRILIGFAVGSIIGIALGSLMAASRKVRWLIDPFIELTRPLPPLAFIPLLIVWFGIGELPKIILITLGVIPILTVATVAALEEVPQEMLDSSLSLGASSAYTLVHVRLRAAVPFIVTAMRLALGVSWTSIVAAELIVARAGLGYLIQEASLFLRTSLIFAGIAIIGILGITMDGILRLLLRKLDPARVAR